jgi:hypothetical protein
MNRASADKNTNPFPGLRPFREDEEYLFFGRENQVDAMVDKLAATRFLAVVGTSGSGKSSLVNCGLRPALHGGLMARAGTAWRMAQFRPGSNPMRAMARALAEDGVLFSDYQAGGLTLAEIVDTTLRMSKLGLIDIYEQAQLGEDVNLLVVVDQFEEMFRYRQFGQQQSVTGVSEEAAAFVNLLLAVKEQTRYPIYVVLTMRSDFLGDCTQFPGLAEAINAGQYLVPRMTRDERRAAISGPVGVGGAEIFPVLLTRLVNDVGDNPDQLSILQHALNRTWNQWERSGDKGPLDLPHYEAIGTMAHALDQHAERAYAELTTARQQQICEKLFKALTDKATDPRGVRRPTTLGTLCALADATPAEVTQVIDVFRQPSRSFLMPPAGDSLEAETVIDISHESLMRVWERLKTWADEEAQSAHIYKRLAETAVLHGQRKAGLWNDPDLQVALDWQGKNQPNKDWARRYDPGFEGAIVFLQASEKKRADDEAERVRQQNAEVERARRELQQAQSLVEAQQQRAEAERQKAEEQRQRLEQQARAASRMRRLLVAFAVVALLALASTVFAFNAYKKADAAKAEAEILKTNAIKGEESAKSAKLEAERQTEIAVAATKDAKDKQVIALKETEKAKTAAREAEEQRQIAETQKRKADVASERVKAEALKGLALGALKDGNPDEAFAQFKALAEHYQRMKDSSGQAYALANIGDIYKDRVPFGVLELSFTEDPDPPEEGDITAAYSAMLKQYSQLAALEALEGEGKNEKAVLEKLSEDGKQAIDYYNRALNANKSKTNADELTREAVVLKDLGDLQVFLVILNAKIGEEADNNENDKGVDKESERGAERGIQYYLEARVAYVKAQRPLEEAGVTIRIADLLEKLRSMLAPSSSTGQTQAAEHEDAAKLERIASFFEEASDAFHRANKPLKEASALIRVGETYGKFPGENAEAQRKAILYRERALQIFRIAKSFKKEGDLISKELAELYGSDERKQIALYQEAFEAYRRASSAEQKQTSETSGKAAEMLKKAGSLLFKSGGKGEANKFFEEAITASGKDSSVSKAQTLTAIGEFYREKKDNAEALKYYGRKVNTWAGNLFEQGNTLFEIGSIQSESGNISKAIEKFDDARQVYRQIDAQAVDANGTPLRSTITTNLIRMAVIYAKQDKEKGIAAYEEALQWQMLSQKLSSNYYSVVQTVEAEGRILLEMKTNEGKTRAEALFQRVIESIRSTKIVGAETYALNEIGDLYKNVGDPAEARVYYERSRSTSLTNKNASGLIGALTKIGGLETEGNKGKSVVDYYLSEAEAAGRAHDLLTQGAAFELAADFYRYRQAPKAIPYYEQARLAYHEGGQKAREILVLRALVSLYGSIDKPKSQELEKLVTEMSRTP